MTPTEYTGCAKDARMNAWTARFRWDYPLGKFGSESYEGVLCGVRFTATLYANGNTHHQHSTAAVDLDARDVPDGARLHLHRENFGGGISWAAEQAREMARLLISLALGHGDPMVNG